MKKLVEIAESYVEWVALGVGGLFLLLMMFAYLLSTPISAEIGSNKKVTLSDVDRAIYTEIGQSLEEQMNKNVDVPLSVKPFATQYKDALAMKGIKPIELADDNWFGPGALPGNLPNKKDHTIKDTDTLVKELPEPLPPAAWNGVASGRSLISPPAVAAGGPGAAAVPAVVPAVVSGVAGTGVPTGPVGIDKLWVTEAFSIPTDEIDAAFTEAGVPANLPTAFLSVETIREEQLSSGAWGHTTIVKPLSIYTIPALPAEGSLSDEATYLTWAVSNTSTLLLPAFHPIVGGDKWYAPGQPNPNTVVPDATLRPITPPTPTVPKAPRVRRTGTSSGSRTQQRRTNRNYAPADSRPAAYDMYAQATPAMAPGMMPPGMMPPGMMPPGYAPGMVPPGYTGATPAVSGGVAVPTSGIPDGFVVPTGNFIPHELQKDVFVWVHDDTVEPGKTYRYKIRYRLKNPVYRSSAVADPKLARQFALVSEESNWSDPVVIPPTVYVFLASGVTSGTTSAKFEVLRWQNGKWYDKSFNVQPGDVIGAKDKESDVDYTTQWTLVDMKSDVVTLEPKVVLADPDGELITRSLRNDQTEVLSVKKQVGYVEPVKPTAPGAVPGAPGAMPPGVVMPPGMMPPGMMPPGMMPPGMRQPGATR